MRSVSKRAGTSNSKSAATATPFPGAVMKVTSPVVVSRVQPEVCSTPPRVSLTVPATGFATVRLSMTPPLA